jgi:hypothetical protein
MTIRRLHLGDFHPSLETAFAQSLHGLCPRGDARGVLVVVPNRLLATHLRRRAAQLGTPTFGLELRSLEDLTAELAAPLLAEDGVRRMPEWTAPLLLAGILAARDETSWTSASGAGWARALAATVRDLRDALVEPRALSAALETTGLAAVPRLRDLAAVYEAYVARLRRKPRLADAATVASAARRALEEGRAAFAPRALLLYGFYDLVARQRRLLERLLGTPDHVEVFLPSAGGPAFEYAEPMRRWLAEDLGFDLLQGDVLLPSSDLIALRNRLFAAPGQEPARGDGSVRWLSTPNESGEALEVLRRLAERPAASTLVVLRQDQPGTERFRAAARGAGVGLHIESAPLAASPAGRAATALLRLAIDRATERVGSNEGTMPRTAVEDLLVVGGLAPSLFPPGSRPERWIQALRGRGLVAGLAGWRRFVEQYATSTPSAQGTLPFAGRASRPRHDDEDGERDRRLLRELRPLADWVARLLDTTALLGAETRQWSRRVEAARTVFGAWLAPSVERDRLLADLETLADLDGVLAPTLENFAAAWNELAAAPSPAAASPEQASFGDAPTVAALAAVRGVTADRVVLPALTERSFPRRPSEDPLLLDHERSALDAAGIQLPRKRDGFLSEERLLFRLAVGAARSELVFSWPRRAEDGRPIVPSSFLGEAAATLLGRPLRFAELADGPGPARRATHDERALAIERVGYGVPVTSLLGSEADLALVARRRPGDQGTIAELATIHPGLAPSLLAERRRRGANRNRLTAHDGLVEPALAVAWIERRRDPASGAIRLSASALESYARCSFHFFQGRVLEVSTHPPPERRLDLDPRTTGSIYHAALRVLFERILADGAAGLWPLSDPERLERALALVDPALDELLDRRAALLEDLPPAMAAGHRRRAAEDLKQFLRSEAAASDGWTPRDVELEIGRTAPVILDYGAVRLALRGRVDRVDTGPLGLRVVDYKTSRSSERWAEAPGSLRGGERLQLALYRRALQAGGAREEVHGAYRGVSWGSGFATASWAPEHFAAADAEAEVILPAIVRGVGAGEFFQVWRDYFCERFCDFRAVCGPGPGLSAMIRDKAGDPRVVAAAEWRTLGEKRAADTGDEGGER